MRFLGFVAMMIAIVFCAAPCLAQYQAPATTVTAGTTCTGSNFLFPTSTGGFLQCNGSTWQAVSSGTGSAASYSYGMMIDYAGSTAPTGWMLCYGQAISRTTYSGLYAVIGTTYGRGDGSTTFNLPDLRGRVTAGLDNMGGTAAGRLTSASDANFAVMVIGTSGGNQMMQAHSHTVTYGIVNNDPSVSNAYRLGGAGGRISYATDSYGSGQSQNVQPTIIVNKIIYVGP